MRDRTAAASGPGIVRTGADRTNPRRSNNFAIL
jgi:hypothetical protein